MKIRAVLLFLAVFLACGLAGAEQPGSASPPLKLALDDCIKLGLSNSPQIKMAEANVKYSEGKLISTRSYLIPKVTASALATRMNTLPTFVIGAPSLIPTTFPMVDLNTPLPPDHRHFVPFPSFEMSNNRLGDVYQMKIQAEYALYTGGRTQEGYNAAKLQVDSNKADLAQQRQNLVFQIKQVFYSVLLAQEMVKVVDQSYQIMEDHHKQVQALYKEGYVSNLDVIQIEARLSSIRPQQIQAQNGLQLAKIALAALLYIDYEQEIEVVGVLDYYTEDIQPLDEIMELALNKRPELQSLVDRKKQTQSLIKIAQAGWLPTVGAFANYQWNRGQDMPPNDKKWEPGYQYGVSASIPLFDGFQAYGETQAAKSQYAQVTWGEQALRGGIRTEVSADYLQLLSARESVDAEKKNVEAAEKNYDAAEKRYREGYVNQLDVLDAEINLTAARAGYLRAISNYLTAKAALEKAMGLEV